MAAEAIDAVQLQVLVELRQAHEALQRRLLHSLDIGKAHVIRDQRRDLLGIFVGEMQAPANLLRHAHPDLDVAVEANAVGRDAKGRRLADIVQQRAPGQRARAARRQLLQQQAACASTHRLRDETAAAARRPSCGRSPAAPRCSRPVASSSSKARGRGLRSASWSARRAPARG